MKNNKYNKSTEHTCELELKNLKKNIVFRGYEERKTYNIWLILFLTMCILMYVSEYPPDNEMLIISVAVCYLFITLAKYINIYICCKDDINNPVRVVIEKDGVSIYDVNRIEKSITLVEKFKASTISVGKQPETNGFVTYIPDDNVYTIIVHNDDTNVGVVIPVINLNGELEELFNQLVVIKEVIQIDMDGNTRSLSIQDYKSINGEFPKLGIVEIDNIILGNYKGDNTKK